MATRPGTKIGVAVLAAMAGACSIFTDLTGLYGAEQPTPLPDRSAPSDSQSDAPSIGEDGGGGIAPDAGPFHPKYERAATVTNVASTEPLPAGSTQCFLVDTTGFNLQDRVRIDFGDVRIFGPKTERLRTIDVRRAGFVSFCFSLERAIPPGSSETYVLFYGDPNATAPPPAEPQLFAFWEGFDGTTLSAQRWLVLGSALVGNGMLTLPKGQNAVTTKAGQDEIPALASLEIRARIVDPLSKGSPEVDGGSEFFWWVGFQHKGDFIASQPWSVFIGRGIGSFRAEHKTNTGVCMTECKTGDKAQDADFRVYKIDRRTKDTALIDDEGFALVAEGTNGDESVMLRNWLVTSDLVVDWARARPIVDPEPRLDIGPEELVP
jgi:hypothetical protein